MSASIALPVIKVELDRLICLKSSLSPLSGRLSKVAVCYLISLIFPFVPYSSRIPVSSLPQPRDSFPDFDKFGT